MLTNLKEDATLKIILIKKRRFNMSSKYLSKTTKIMKQLNDIIVSPLAELVNKLFQNGIFPDIFKNAKVILIFKSES